MTKLTPIFHGVYCSLLLAMVATVLPVANAGISPKTLAERIGKLFLTEILVNTSEGQLISRALGITAKPGRYISTSEFADAIERLPLDQQSDLFRRFFKSKIESERIRAKQPNLASQEGEFLITRYVAKRHFSLDQAVNEVGRGAFTEMSETLSPKLMFVTAPKADPTRMLRSYVDGNYFWQLRETVATLESLPSRIATIGERGEINGTVLTELKQIFELVRTRLKQVSSGLELRSIYSRNSGRKLTLKYENYSRTLESMHYNEREIALDQANEDVAGLRMIIFKLSYDVKFDQHFTALWRYSDWTPLQKQTLVDIVQIRDQIATLTHGWF